MLGRWELENTYKSNQAEEVHVVGFTPFGGCAVCYPFYRRERAVIEDKGVESLERGESKRNGFWSNLSTWSEAGSEEWSW